MKYLLLILTSFLSLSKIDGQSFTIFDNATTINSTSTGLSFSRTNSTGINNVAIGANSMPVNTSGADNVAIGTNTLSLQLEGRRNTAVGTEALKNMKGNYSNYSNTYTIIRGEDNIALGYRAMAGGTYSGGSSPIGIYATNNIAIGSRALEEVEGRPDFAGGVPDTYTFGNGTYNIAIGQSALKKTRNGAGNIGIGREALMNTDGYLSNFNPTTIQGRDNIGLGYRTLYNNVTGENNIAIGNSAGVGSSILANDSYKLYIGGGNTPLIGGDLYNGKVGINKTVASLASSTAKLQVGGDILCLGVILYSDIRYKKNILKIGNALHKINQIQGVTYNLKKDEFPEMNFSNKTQIGFIAQEVEKVLPELVETNTTGYKSIDYVKIVPVLLEAIKELNNEKNLLYDEVRLLKSNFDELKAVLEKSSHANVQGK
jgi:hypothetical protein